MRIAIIALAGALAACSPQPATQAMPGVQPQKAGRHSESGLRVVPLTVETPKGPHSFRVEVAESDAEQAQGLMFRTSLGPDEGMIFPRNPPDVASFWMKNTPLPLDIIFVGTDRRVLNIANAVPYSLEPLSAAGMTALVLEIPGGRASQLGIKPGSKVDW